MIGPGAVLLAGSIGGGEWLVGPAVAVRYGLHFMCLVPVAIFFQLILNLQAICFTLDTGEPVYVGFLRLSPHPEPQPEPHLFTPLTAFPCFP